MLVGADRGAIEHDVLEIAVLADRFEHPIPNAFGSPTRKARKCAMPIAQFWRQITPRRTGSANPQNRLYKQTVIAGCHAAVSHFTGQQRFYSCPLVVSNYASVHSGRPFRKLPS
jgi:hypothetical protein